MKRIRQITDLDILGTEGLSNAKPRLTARAIIRNHESLYAVMYASAFDLYSLPDYPEKIPAGPGSGCAGCV